MQILNSKKILFIGGGNMATAIITGLINSNITPKNITVIDHNNDKLDKLKQLLNVNILNNLADLIRIEFKPDIIILAVKPLAIKTACIEINSYINDNTLVISVAAGVSIDNLNKWLTNTNNLIRSMPNTPSSIGLGVSILYPSSHSKESKSNIDVTNELFNAIGSVVWVNTEDEINKLMAISGCGPAYVFLLCESLMAGALELNINSKTAKQLITATIEGACKLYDNSDKSADTLRAEVTSPNGTTEAAINTLNPENSKKLYTKALQAAVNKAKIIEEQLG